jgi:hypothetical protein
MGSARTPGWAIKQAYGVAAVSYFTVIFAPWRTLLISFCCG